MSLASGHKGRPGSIMDKKIHQNPRYRGVSSRTNTGSSLSKYNQKMDDIKNNYKFKQGEIFKRMKVSTFVQLVIQVENYIPEEQIGLSPIPDDDSLPPTPTSDEPPATDRSCDSRFSDVIRGIGEYDARKPQVPETLCEKPDTPYLLLDVRTEDAYDLCHIIGAVNYPSAMLSRAQNCFTKEMLNYINKDGKIIIVYDEDEKLAHMCSTTMIERGVDNLFMLSGGLKVLSSKFPKGIIRGPLPKVCLVDADGRLKKPKSKVTPAPACEHIAGNDFTESDLEVLEDTLDNLMLSMAGPSRIGGMSRAQSMLSNKNAAQTKSWK